MSDLNSLIHFGSDLDFQMESNYEDFSTSNEAPDFMCSEFFDSILSLEKDGITEGGNGVSDIEVGECGLSTYSDSGLSSEFNTDQLLSDEELFSVCSMLEQTVSSDSSEAGDNSQIASVTPPPQSVQSQPPVITIPDTVVPISKPAAVVQPNIKETQPQAKPKVINILKPTPKQVFKIQTVGGNSKSLLLPINIKDLKTIKIINTNSMKAEELKITSPPKKVHLTTSTGEPLAKRMAVQPKRMAACLPTKMSCDTTTYDNPKSSAPEIKIESNDDQQYPLLVLTPEEKRLLCKDGIELPLRYPLSKTQERELKRIRRKIRNKISAQDSRKRKKEYVDGLEERVKQCSEENRSLLKKIKLLQTQNNKLSSQLSKLQALIFKSGSTRAHPATCLMIVVLSVMLVSLPNLRNLSGDKELNSLQQFAARRALLFDQQATNEDLLATDELTTKRDSNNVIPEEPVVLPAPAEEVNATRKKFGELFLQIGRSIMSQLGSSISLEDTGGGVLDGKETPSVTHTRPLDPPIYDGKATRKRTIEFDVDESWPPEKKRNTTTNFIHHAL